ncbi:MAG: LytR family transcriptional regulator [Ruminococcaceae bacterium]|nr:LytR family transcriptional regulator [Oscillospiraceae bacterium]
MTREDRLIKMSTRERMDFPQKEKRIETLVIVAFTIVALVIGAVIVAKNFSPAEPIIDDEIPFHTGDVETQTDDEGNKVVPSGTEEKYIRREGVYNFLFVGYDKAAGLTDVIMIAQFDTNTGAINIVQVPRDTYARYNERGSYRKINGALSYYDRELADFASFLEMNLCLKIDYYASVNLVAFRNIVDIIGGVEMYVPRRMFYDDPEQGLYIDLYEGYQTLDGNKAEQFVRFRSGYVNADIGRTDAQKLFMTAFMKKFISGISVSMLSQVGAQVLKYANTNLTLNEFIYFATKVLDIDLDKLTMMTLPGSDAREYKTYGTWYYVLSRSAMLDTINKYLNVYERDIPDSIFDPNKVFTNPDADYMLELYNTEDLPDVYVGNEVDEDGIYIPARKEQPSVDADAPAEDTTEAVGDTEDTEPVDEPTDETENNDDEY